MSTVSFTLEVRITGICLFVPEPNASPARVTVLLPQTSGAAAHRSVLIYDTQFGGGPCDDVNGRWCLHELAGTELRLANGSAPHLSIPGIYQLNRPGCARKANPTDGKAPGAEAKTILGSGYCEYVPPGARFLVDGAAARMAYEVCWVIPDMLHSDLTFTDIDTGAKKKTIALRVNQNDRVVLYVRCVPQAEVWPDTPHSKPDKDMPVHHFAELAKLLVPGHYPIGIPQWRNDLNDGPFATSSGTMQPAEVRGNPYTCMPGQTEPGP